MGADSWDTCPRCYDAACAANDALGDYAVPEVDASKFLTFREDYEFYGAHTGTVIVSYSGWCTTCHLAVKHDNQVEFYAPTHDAPQGEY